jgi:hypothetical protein
MDNPCHSYIFQSLCICRQSTWQSLSSTERLELRPSLRLPAAQGSSPLVSPWGQGLLESRPLSNSRVSASSLNEHPCALHRCRDEAVFPQFQLIGCLNVIVRRQQAVSLFDVVAHIMLRIITVVSHVTIALTLRGSYSLDQNHAV